MKSEEYWWSQENIYDTFSTSTSAHFSAGQCLLDNQFNSLLGIRPLGYLSYFQNKIGFYMVNNSNIFVVGYLKYMIKIYYNVGNVQVVLATRLRSAQARPLRSGHFCGRRSDVSNVVFDVGRWAGGHFCGQPVGYI